MNRANGRKKKALEAHFDGTAATTALKKKRRGGKEYEGGGKETLGLL